MNKADTCDSDQCCPAPQTLNIDGDVDEELARIAKALAHPARVQILRILARQKDCFCGDIVEHVPLAQSTVSQHLKIMKESGVIHGEIDGVRTCYCIEPRVLSRFKSLVNDL